MRKIALMVATMLLLAYSGGQLGAGELMEEEARRLISADLQGEDIIHINLANNPKLWQSELPRQLNNCWTQGPFDALGEQQQRALGYYYQRDDNGREVVFIFGDGGQAGLREHTPFVSPAMKEECKAYLRQAVLQKLADGHWYPTEVFVVKRRATVGRIVEILTRDGQATVSFTVEPKYTEFYSDTLRPLDPQEVDQAPHVGLLPTVVTKYRPTPGSPVVEPYSEKELKWQRLEPRPDASLTFTWHLTEYDQGWRVQR